MKHSHPLNKQHGFTLIELLVVVSMLASIATIAVITLDGYEESAQEQLAHAEMKNIASAIYRFKEDTGYFPKEGIFSADKLFGSDSSNAKDRYMEKSNLGWLFSNPKLHDTNGDGDTNGSDGDPTKVLVWNPNTGRGWHGPYITTESQSKYATAPDDYCSLKSETFSAAVINDEQEIIVSISDRFLKSKTYSSGDGCFVARDNSQWVQKAVTGQPYKYEQNYSNGWHLDCESGKNTCVALLSAGSDGEFDNNDDIVKVLRVNP